MLDLGCVGHSIHLEADTVLIVTELKKNDCELI